MFNREIKNWLLAIFWMGVIFALSNTPNLKSDFPNEWDFVLRKIAHITEFGVLTFLYFRALEETLRYRGRGKAGRALVLAGFLAFIYATLDEYHQFFVLGRSASLFDVSIDSIGILLALLVLRKKV